MSKSITTPVSVIPLEHEHGVGVKTLLVDYKPGSKLDLHLQEIERKLDHIFALLVASK